MRSTFTAILLVFVPLVVRAGPALAADDLRVGASIENGSLTEFHLAIGRHYHADAKHVRACRARGIPDDDIPVVLHVAARAHVGPDLILEMRSTGQSWMGICAHFGFGAEIFHVEVDEIPGPPYGKAYGYYRNRPRSEWHTIRLHDDEVAHLVNVRFLAEYHKCPPSEILRKHRKGESFASFHARVKKEREAGNKSRGTANERGGRDEPRGPGRDDSPGGRGKGSGGGKGKGGKRK
jgi:hypothetical protein